MYNVFLAIFEQSLKDVVFEIQNNIQKARIALAAQEEDKALAYKLCRNNIIKNLRISYSIKKFEYLSILSAYRI